MIRLKELEIKAKEVALNEGELTERAKLRPKDTLPKFILVKILKCF